MRRRPIPDLPTLCRVWIIFLAAAFPVAARGMSAPTREEIGGCTLRTQALQVRTVAGADGLAKMRKEGVNHGGDRFYAR